MSNKDYTMDEHLPGWREGGRAGSPNEMAKPGAMVQKKNAAKYRRRGIDDSEGAVALAGPPRHDSIARPHHGDHPGKKGRSMDKGHLPSHIVRRGCEDNSKGTETPVSLPSHQFWDYRKMTPMAKKAKHEIRSPPEKIARHTKTIASTEPDYSMKTPYFQEKKVAYNRWTPIDAIVENMAFNDSDDSSAHPKQKTSDSDKKYNQGYDIENGKGAPMDEGKSDERMDAPTSYNEESTGEEEHNEEAALPRNEPRRRPNTTLVRGTVRVLGIDGDPVADLAESEDKEAQGEHTVPEIQAELVNREEEERKFRERMIHDVPYAEVQTDSPHTKRRVVLGGIAFVLIAIAVSVSLRMTLPKKEPMTQPLDALLASVSFDGGEALRTPSTPQSMAYEWLVNDTNLDTYTDRRKIHRYILATLYFSLNGTGWLNNLNWLADGDECGVWGDKLGVLRCTGDGEVVELHLSSNNLVGRLPPEIGLLSSSLVILNLEENQLSGSIPAEIGQWTVMMSLSLYDNQLSGTIPTEIGLLTSMGEDFLSSGLMLDNNRLSGSIPTEIGSLTAMESLDLSENQLTGTIPSVIHNMTSLNGLSLYDNEFTGSFTCPEFISRCYISCNSYQNETCRSL